MKSHLLKKFLTFWPVKSLLKSHLPYTVWVVKHLEYCGHVSDMICGLLQTWTIEMVWKWVWFVWWSTSITDMNKALAMFVNLVLSLNYIFILWSNIQSRHRLFINYSMSLSLYCRLHLHLTMSPYFDTLLVRWDAGFLCSFVISLDVQMIPDQNFKSKSKVNRPKMCYFLGFPNHDFW